MKFIGLLFILMFSITTLAQTVQVPENCLGKISPCLIHTDEKFFDFNYDGQRVRLLKEGILKVSFDEMKSQFELIDGRIDLKKVEKNQKTFFINGRQVKTGWVKAGRVLGRLSILDMKSFNLSVFEQLAGSSSEFIQVKSDFVDKSDFVGFTKYYFQNLTEYKKFLAEQAGNWKTEFAKQNKSQTKVLMRKIASEREKALLEARKKSAQTDESKKVRELFFYRTFER